jgi:hypothetical protein
VETDRFIDGGDIDGVGDDVPEDESTRDIRSGCVHE